MSQWAAYFVVFMASACTMVIELVAGRILAPYIGVSLYTWTSIIGVCLAGISVGNYLGGRIADRYPTPRTLGVLLAAAGIASLAILPLISIANAIPTGQIIDATNRLGGTVQIDRALIIIARIVVTTTIIFLPPVLILGMISPVVIKLSLRDLRTSGGTVGKLYAISTFGAIVGTFATGFVLVQTFGTRMIVFAVAVVVLAIALIFGDLLGAIRTRKIAAPLAAGLLLLFLLIPARNVFAYGCFEDQWAVERGECLTRSFTDGLEHARSSDCLEETGYFCIKVYDQLIEDRHLVKTLVLDHLIHSYNSMEDPSYLHYGYIKVYAEVADMLARRLPDQNLRVLYIGGGGYTLPRHVEATYPNAEQEVIEIDPGVTRTVYEHLGVDPATTDIVTYNYDARLLLSYLGEEKAGTYDLIIGDAFNDLSVPYHLTTLEFNQMLKRLLKPDGFYLALVIDKLQGGKFIPAFAKTANAVWPEVTVLADGGFFAGQAASTYVVSASNQPLTPESLDGISGQGFEGSVTTKIMPPDQYREWIERANPPLLTDEYAPVDNMLAPIFAERGF